MKNILKKHPVKILRGELQNIKKTIKMNLDELKAISKIPKNKVIDLLIKHNFDISKLPPLVKKEPKPKQPTKPKQPLKPQIPKIEPKPIEPPKQPSKQPQEAPKINPITDTLLTLQEKYNNYEKIIKYIDLLDIKDGCISLTDKKDVYNLTENLLLYEQIGSKSAFGVVFQTRNINFNYKDIPDMALKIQQITKSTEQEKEIFKIISDIGIKDKIIHFPIFYKTLTCSNKILKGLFEYPKPVNKAQKKDGKYEIILNELANGDLYEFFKNKKIVKNEKLVINIFIQSIIALTCLHSIGYLHNDTHYGNFLYYKIREGGCFHYKINDKDYYIENLGYLVTTTDYGLSRPMKPNKFYKDYNTVIDSLAYNNQQYLKMKNIDELLREFSYILDNNDNNEIAFIENIKKYFDEKKGNIVSSINLKIGLHEPKPPPKPPSKPKTPPPPKPPSKPKTPPPPKPPSKPKTPPPPKPPSKPKTPPPKPPPKPKTPSSNLVCEDINVIPQFAGTCWFNTILTVLFYSQYSRTIMMKYAQNWDKKDNLFKIFKIILKRNYKDKRFIEWLNIVKPEIILLKLTKKYDPNLYLDFINRIIKNGNTSNLGYTFDYLSNFLNYLNVNYLTFQSNETNTYIQTHYISLEETINSSIEKKQKEIEKNILDIPDYLIYYYGDENHIRFLNLRLKTYQNKEKLDVKNYETKYKFNMEDIKSFKPIITFNGHKYKLDSSLINNFNIFKQGGHAIAGITCNDEKYVYNGWNSKTEDASMNILDKNKMIERPCSLMMFDWDLRKKQEDFCLNSNKCKLDKINSNNLCFNFSKATNGVLIYTRIDINKYPIEIDNENTIIDTTKFLKEFVSKLSKEQIIHIMRRSEGIEYSKYVKVRKIKDLRQALLLELKKIY